jgi:hypothetical protein
MVVLFIQAFEHLPGWPRDIVNLARPCVVQPEVDPLHMRRGVVQHVAQHLSLIGLDGLTLFQLHALSHVVLHFPIIVEQYQSYIVLPHVGPHYTQPF